MIKIDRNREAIPRSLRDRNSAGSTERAEAIRFYETQKGKLRSTRVGKPFLAKDGKTSGYGAYRSPDVKEALHRLFHGKCAYCESRWSAVMPMDVEHWRPKGKVEHLSEERLRERVDYHPGYYWLAAEWTNLLPSCRDCNSPRRQPGLHREPVTTKGKGNLFPVAKGSYATWRCADCQETPLLLDPCGKVDPGEHLLFLAEADGVVLSRSSPEDPDDDPAAMSIEVYALNRAGLVQERLAVLRQIERRMGTIRCLAERLAKTKDPDGSTDLEDLLAFELAALARARCASSPYAQMAQQVIDRFMDELLADG